MAVYECDFFKGFIRIGTDGFNKGWHERNGGNLSYRMTPEDVAEAQPNFKEDGDWTPIGTSVPDLGNAYFLVTGSGKFFKNLERDPENAAGIIELDSSGERYRTVWGFSQGGKPTSELPTHLMNHAVKKEAGHRVIYHAHATNVIALTFVLPLEAAVFTRELWEMATECPVVFPQGVGVVKWMVPGGREIAVETSKLMETYNAVIWAHHGIFCSGTDFDETFGLMDTIEKSAEILVKVRAMGDTKRQTIEPDDFRKLAKSFGVAIDPAFLYEKKA